MVGIGIIDDGASLYQGHIIIPRSIVAVQVRAGDVSFIYKYPAVIRGIVSAYGYA
jgi:hypothetical protein